MTIYVVNHRRPNQAQGDWAVKSGSHVISRHRLKSAAVDKARREARKRDCGYQVQKSDGKWQEH